MKKIIKVLLITVLMFNTLMPVRAQGLKFETGLNWEQVKQKAKAENKLIFLDVMATWCGPCKYMDANVYPNDTV
jgi:thiol:disulfide interchange protein